ncbi:MAG: serine hydrolase [Oscillospiraceae bacterium]|nr:serine hydrolase [Oscillospiraceae bacterium]
MKRLFALLSAAVMLLSAGCAESEKESAPETTAAVTQTTAGTVPSTTETTVTTSVTTKTTRPTTASTAAETTTETTVETTAETVILETAAPDATDAPPVADEVIPDYAQYYEYSDEDDDDDNEYAPTYEEDPVLPEGVEDEDVPPAEIVTTKAPATTKAAATTATTKTIASKTTVSAKPTNSIPAMNELVKKYSKSCAVMLYSMDGTELYSYRPDVLISGASLIKLPYCIYVCQQIEKGERSLTDTLKYTSKFYHGGSGIIRKNGYNKTYTISQLIDYTLRYSDNVGYDMLVYLFGTKGFNDMVKSWGYSISISAYTRFPAVSANFMKTAMEKMQAHSADGNSWKTAWAALNGSSVSRVREQIGTKNGEIAVKYGSISAQYHETCYIAGDTPYILVILSPAKSYKPDVTFVKNIAKTAVKIVNEHEQAKRTTTTTTTTATTVTETTDVLSDDPTASLPSDPATQTGETEVTIETLTSDLTSEPVTTTETTFPPETTVSPTETTQATVSDPPATVPENAS